MNDRQAEYREYLKSEHWAALRQLALERDGKRCRKRASEWTLEVHHRSYARNWYSVTVDMLETLCVRCHVERHNPPKKRRFKRPDKCGRCGEFDRQLDDNRFCPRCARKIAKTQNTISKGRKPGRVIARHINELLESMRQMD